MRSFWTNLTFSPFRYDGSQISLSIRVTAVQFQHKHTWLNPTRFWSGHHLNHILFNIKTSKNIKNLLQQRCRKNQEVTADLNKFKEGSGRSRPEGFQWSSGLDEGPSDPVRTRPDPKEVRIHQTAELMVFLHQDGKKFLKNRCRADIHSQKLGVKILIWSLPKLKYKDFYLQYLSCDSRRWSVSTNKSIK